MSELSEWPTLSLGSSSDVKPNPFLDTSEEWTGPIYPGRFSLSSIHVIPEESLEELVSEVTQALSDNLTLLLLSRTSMLPFINLTTTLQTKSDMTAKLNMPMPLSLSTPKWDGQSRTLRNFLRIMEQLFQTAEITEGQKKLDWITGYVDANIHDQWTSFEEYEAGSWNQFLERLKTEYPELTTEEQGSMDNLRKLCRKNAGINLLEEERLMSFKRRFVYIAQKCLRPPAVTENRELVELFVKTLDSAFQDALNSRLSIQGTLKVDTQGRSRIEDPYDLDHVVQKAIELISGKTIAWALKHMPVILSRNGKVDPDTRGPVYYSKEESVRKVKAHSDVEALQQDINVLKTLYEKQERSREHYEKSIQRALDSIKTLIHSQGQMLAPTTKEVGGFPMRYGQGPPQIWLARPARKCFYCFETNHLFLFCPKKTKDEKKGLILVDKFTVRFTNGEPIPIEHNMSIKDCVRKHLSSSITVMIWGDPELETCSIWDQELDTGGVMVLFQLVRRQMEALSREHRQLEELSHLRKKVSSLEVMLQKMSLEREPTPELEEEGMESFLRRMAAEYVQTRQNLAPRKKLGF